MMKSNSIFSFPFSIILFLSFVKCIWALMHAFTLKFRRPICCFSPVSWIYPERVLVARVHTVTQTHTHTQSPNWIELIIEFNFDWNWKANSLDGFAPLTHIYVWGVWRTDYALYYWIIHTRTIILMHKRADRRPSQQQRNG